MRRDGVEHFNAAEDWQQRCKRGLQFEPYSGDTHIRIIRGTCLNPLITAGEVFRVRDVADDETLIDGGLYMIEWSNESETQLYRDQINAPRTETILIAKFLKYLCAEWWVVCRDSFARLDGIVVGQVVGVVSANAPAVHASQIGINAATTTYSLSVAGPNTYNAGTIPAGPTYYGQVSVPAKDVNTVVSATLTFDCVQTVAANFAQVFIEAAWGATQSSDICEIDMVSNKTRYTIQKFFTGIAANVAFTVTIRLGCSGSASFTMTNTLLNVEVIKR